ncbi:hypothetical protein ACFX1S_023466 [Malus domestica]|uniref:Uncharacterized protein n=1 Tax=Malus domestica TaxID=3750 RepID=A0A498HDV7_MALDO|nr:hypothetical protein DVH24_037430 [Malus domestica]
MDIYPIAVKAEASHPAHDLDVYPIFAKLIYLNQAECNLWWIFTLTNFWEMGPGRVECVGPRLTKLRGQYYIRLVFFANREGASGTYDEAKEV